MASIDIFLTSQCNKQCACCFVKDKVHAASLSKADIDRMLPHLTNAGIERVALIGGEPTIYPHLAYITRALKKNNIRYDIFSNGLFDAAFMDTIDLEGVQISVHLPTDDAMLAKTVANLRYLHQRKAEAVVRDVITEGYDFSAALRFIKAHRDLIVGVRVKIAQPNVGRSNQYVQDIGQIKKGLLSFLRILDKMKVDVSNCCFLPFCEFSVDELEFLKRINYLSRCQRVFYIDTDLSVKFCPYHNEIFGQIEDLRAILARKHLIKLPVYPKCATCDHYRQDECIPCFSYSDGKDDLKHFRERVLSEEPGCRGCGA